MEGSTWRAFVQRLGMSENVAQDGDGAAGHGVVRFIGPPVP